MKKQKNNTVINLPDEEQKKAPAVKRKNASFSSSHAFKKKRPKKISSNPDESVNNSTATDSASSKSLLAPIFTMNDPYSYPRCEYYWRYKGTSYFEMRDTQYWSTYHRSDHTRYAKVVGKGNAKYQSQFHLPRGELKRSDQNNPYYPKTGSYKNPLSDPRYAKRIQYLGERPKIQKRAVDSIREKQLEYRLKMGAMIIREFKSCFNENELKNIEAQRPIVYMENDFPCVLVSMPWTQQAAWVKPSQKQTQRYWSQETKSPFFQQLLMAYYVSIVNYNAEQEGIPIEIVMRSSFGHLLPSVAKTGKSFRINMGIIPSSYAKILGRSLHKLYQVFSQFDDKSSKKFPSDRYTKDLDAYNKSNKKAKSKQSLNWKGTYWTVLRQTGSSSGKSVLAEIVRVQASIELLANYVFESLIQNEGNVDEEPIIRMFSGFKLTKNNSVSFSELPKKELQGASSKRAWVKVTLVEDNDFWEVVESILEGFPACNNDDVGSDFIATKNILNLYAYFEKLHANLKVNIEKYDDSSDSDGEVTLTYTESSLHNSSSMINGRFTACEHTELYAKNVIVSTGMYAISAAYQLAQQYLRIKNCADFSIILDHMYYETRDNIKIFKPLPEIQQKTKSSNRILFFDLNHCNAESSPFLYEDIDELTNQITLHKPQILILDYTSATNHKMRQICDLLFTPVVYEAYEDSGFEGSRGCSYNPYLYVKLRERFELIIFINSGLKYESGGADRNPFGTLGIICNNKEDIEAIYAPLKNKLKGDEGYLPPAAYNLRRIYKKLGYVSSLKHFIADWCYHKGLSYEANNEREKALKEFSKACQLDFPHAYKFYIVPILKDSEEYYSRVDKMRYALSSLQDRCKLLINQINYENPDLEYIKFLLLCLKNMEGLNTYKMDDNNALEHAVQRAMLVSEEKQKLVYLPIIRLLLENGALCGEHYCKNWSRVREFLIKNEITFTLGPRESKGDLRNLPRDKDSNRDKEEKVSATTNPVVSPPSVPLESPSKKLLASHSCTSSVSCSGSETKTVYLDHQLRVFEEEAGRIMLEPKKFKGINYARLDRLLDDLDSFSGQHPDKAPEASSLKSTLLHLLSSGLGREEQQSYHDRVSSQQEDVPSDGNCFFWASARQFIHLLRTNDGLVQQLPSAFINLIQEKLPAPLKEILSDKHHAFNKQRPSGGVLVTNFEDVFQKTLRITIAEQLQQFKVADGVLQNISLDDISFIRDVLNGAIADGEIPEKIENEPEYVTNLRKVQSFLEDIQNKITTPISDELQKTGLFIANSQDDKDQDKKAKAKQAQEQRKAKVQEDTNKKIRELIENDKEYRDKWNEALDSLRAVLLADRCNVGEEAALLLSRFFPNIVIQCDSQNCEEKRTCVSQYYLNGIKIARDGIKGNVPIIHLIKLPWAHYHSAGQLLKKYSSHQSSPTKRALFPASVSATQKFKKVSQSSEQKEKSEEHKDNANQPTNEYQANPLPSTSLMDDVATTMMLEPLGTQKMTSESEKHVFACNPQSPLGKYNIFAESGKRIPVVHEDFTNDLSDDFDDSLYEEDTNQNTNSRNVKK